MSPIVSILTPHALAALLVPRDNPVEDARNTLSSWDSCMAKSYCKWPVIIAIIVGVLVVLSIVVCCARCLCCGLECCCGICRCCNACCPSPRNHRKYEKAPHDPYFPPPQHQPYQQPYQHQPPPQDAMTYSGYRGPAQPAPQFARYDTQSKKSSVKGGHVPGKSEDRLPNMPTLATAQDHKIEDDHDDGVAQEGIPLQEQKQPMMASYQQQQHQAEHDHAASAAYGYPNEKDTSYPYQNHSAMAGGDLGAGSLQRQQTNPAGAAAGYYNSQSAHNHQSPVSPASPVASSVYSARPPPSYHTTAAPGNSGVPPMPTRQGTQTGFSAAPVYAGTNAAGYSSPPPVQRYASPPPQQPQQQQGYSAYAGARSPPPAQQQGGYSAYTPYSGGGQSQPQQHQGGVDPGLFYSPARH